MIPTLKFLVEIVVVSLILIWIIGLAPAAIVTAKGRGGSWFVKGFFTFGITWLYSAATSVGKGRHEDGRARPSQAEGSSAAGLRRFCFLIAIAFLAAIFICRPTPLLGFDRGALEHSIGAGIPGDPCREIDGLHWRCDVYADDGSGSDEYLVHTTAVGCWSARMVESQPEKTGHQMNGCVRLGDFL
ncbi:MAG TPA: hypothetical protein VHO06_13695 [Polyangia bacterium]|nr:hypothetical protein [Polyangia bacterium]